ncbi:MAG: cell division protein FtsA [Acidobacteriota bacterium]|nr:cell division protein FtsA [Acidobacteriota bacterium]
MANRDSYIVALDLGSAKTCALVCERVENGRLRVAGFGKAESRGWRRGVIVNLDSAHLAIKKAVEAAENEAGIPVDNAYVGVGGPHIRGVNSRGGLTLAKPPKTTRQVTHEDARRVFEAAQAVSLPPDREVIFAEPQEYMLDAESGIRNPVGMLGSRLEVDAHLVTASILAHENVVLAVNKSGMRVNATIFEALAAAAACLTPDERELGVAVVDIGGGSSNMAIYSEGCLRYSGVIPVGGDHFTNDIAVGLRTPIPEAEKIKIQWGQCGPEETEKPIEVPCVGERPSRTVSYSTLGEFIEPRVQELLELTAAEIERSGLRAQLRGGIVLTGGGGKLGGMVSLAEQVLELPARLGVPYGLEQMGDILPDSAYATVAGLAIQGHRLSLLRDSHSSGITSRLLGLFGGKN